MYHGSDLIADFVPDDHSRQTSSLQMLNSFLLKRTDMEIILDLGCGEGLTVDLFRKSVPGAKWIGLDIESSQEVDRRKRTDAEFCSYDGVNIPFTENCFDLIYCHQVFEHVQKPIDLIREISRVLKPGGVFIGSTSQLETFHSMSTYNYTPYGFSLLLEGTNLRFLELRPAIDAFFLLLVRIFNRFKLLSKFLVRYFEKESPVNRLIGIAGRLTGKSRKDINLLKLLFCGHFSFYITKTDK